MTNTTLCGYVSYGTNVEKNEDDSELYLDCQINLDNNGTESRYNIYENYNELKILKKILMRIGDIRLHQVMN